MKNLLIALAAVAAVTACSNEGWKFQTNKRIDGDFSFIYVKSREYGVVVACENKYDIRVLTRATPDSKIKARFGTNSVITLEGKQDKDLLILSNAKWAFSNLALHDQLALEYTSRARGGVITETLNIAGFRAAFDKYCGRG